MYAVKPLKHIALLLILLIALATGTVLAQGGLPHPAAMFNSSLFD